jgi:TetR/AcrR family transcriptional regulator, tetracycline repressor protein
MARRKDLVLDKEKILAAAFALLEDEGLQQLSMRKLAARLTVQAPALYWHVAEKSELLGLMAGALYAEARRGVYGAADWREWLVAFGQALRATLTTHRDAALLCATARPVGETPEAVAYRMAAPLLEFGVPEEEALSFIGSVISLTLGWVLFEENGPMHAVLAGAMDFDHSFETGLGALVRGYRY